MSSEKPREWWINNLGAEDWIEGPIAETSEPIHVIEKSEYDVVVTERDSERKDFCKLMNEASDSVDRFRAERELQDADYAVLLRERDELKRQLSGHLKDHADDWRRIQDAERERDRALAALKDIAKETGTPYARIAQAALDSQMGMFDDEGVKK